MLGNDDDAERLGPPAQLARRERLQLAVERSVQDIRQPNEPQRRRGPAESEGSRAADREGDRSADRGANHPRRRLHVAGDTDVPDSGHHRVRGHSVLLRRRF